MFMHINGCKHNIIVLTSKTGNKKRELPEKCNLRPDEQLEMRQC